MTKNSKPAPPKLGRGGARPGAGRPAKLPEAKRRSVMMDDETARMAREIGAGSVSVGIKQAIEFAYAKQKQQITQG